MTLATVASFKQARVEVHHLQHSAIKGVSVQGHQAGLHQGCIHDNTWSARRHADTHVLVCRVQPVKYMQGLFWLQASVAHIWTSHPLTL